MYKIAVIIVCGAAFGLLIMQTAQNADLSLTDAEKAMLKEAAKNFAKRVVRFVKKVLGYGNKDNGRDNSRA